MRWPRWAYETRRSISRSLDFIVADPYKDIAETLKSAFVVGQSNVVGGTLTDMVAIASDSVQAEIGSARAIIFRA